MHFFHNIIVFLTLLASVMLDDIDPTLPPVSAQARVSSGEPRLFSGEDVQMTCSVPDDSSPNWTYQWFHNGRHVSDTEVYTLKRAKVLHSGNYTCVGIRSIDAWPYEIQTLPSDPLEIDVDAGWVLLRTPHEPLIIEDSATLTCHVRDNPLLTEVIFYKNDMVHIIQEDKDLKFCKLTLEDGDIYSCKATWIKNMEHHSAQSLPSQLIVLDKLETPRLELLGSRLVYSGGKMVLRCITKVNVKEQGLNLEYIYIKDDDRLGPASSKDTYEIWSVSIDDSGVYSCKVRERTLKMEKQSNGLRITVRKPRVSKKCKFPKIFMIYLIYRIILVQVLKTY